MQEISAFGDINACINRIPNWCKAIKEEMMGNVHEPVFDEIESLRKEIDEKLNQQADELNGLFSKDEISSLHGKLEQLKEQFEVFQAKQLINEKELSQIKSDIDNIKGDMSAFPKKVWYRTASNKLLSLFIKLAGSKEGRELALHTAETLIPGPTEK